MKTCNDCKKMYPLSEFHKDKSTKDGHMRYCKTCSIKRSRVYREANRELIYKRNKLKAKDTSYRYILKKAYGLSIEDYGKMVIYQEGKCFICHESPEKLHVDHDHITGIVRALLCGKCNRGLGMFNEDPELLESAIRYIKEFCDGS